MRKGKEICHLGLGKGPKELTDEFMAFKTKHLTLEKKGTLLNKAQSLNLTLLLILSFFEEQYISVAKF